MEYTTFKVVVHNADVIENVTNVIEKTPNAIVNVTESGTNNDTNGTMRNNNGTMAEQSADIQDLVLAEIRKNKRVSIKQLSKMFNKTRASMCRIIEKLKYDGKLLRVGSLKSGTWKVIE